MFTVGVVGASGFVGAELMRLIAYHPEFELTLATGDSQAGLPIRDVYPHLAAVVGNRSFDTFDSGALEDLDLVFLALPHGSSQSLMPAVIDSVSHVVDLAADFRLTDPLAYPAWYGEAHKCPDLLSQFAYGQPELNRVAILTAQHVAAPGCYPTAAALALAPLLRSGLVEPHGIVVDAASGVSGAGRGPSAKTSFCTVDETFTAYGLLDHRHTPEMEQILESQVLFTPHLAPMSRGILATTYARPTTAGFGYDTGKLLEHYRAFYAGETFVVVTEESPTTKATMGSNSAHVTVRADPRTGWVIAICAIDNLVKGAAGQGIQAANLLLGVDEACGLSAIGLYP